MSVWNCYATSAERSAGRRRNNQRETDPGVALAQPELLRVDERSCASVPQIDAPSNLAYVDDEFSTHVSHDTPGRETPLFIRFI